MPAKAKQLTFDAPDKKMTKRQRASIASLHTDKLPRYAWVGVISTDNAREGAISVDIGWLNEQGFDEETMALLGMMQVREFLDINRRVYEECAETCRIFGLPDLRTFYAQQNARRQNKLT